jgi:hypothetical protein
MVVSDGKGGGGTETAVLISADAAKSAALSRHIRTGQVVQMSIGA